MASRFVYIPINEKPYVKVVKVDFVWEKGMSLSQRKKSAINLQREIISSGLATKVLECSRAGSVELGVKLSAFNLPYFADKLITVENVYQGSKVFKHNVTGDVVWLNKLYSTPYRDAKREPILTDRNYELLEFRLIDKDNVFNANPRHEFYNYIYIKSLIGCVNAKNIAELLSYDGFTDTMLKWYNGTVTSCQAHATAMYVGMAKAGVLAKYMNNKEEYLKLFK